MLGVTSGTSLEPLMTAVQAHAQAPTSIKTSFAGTAITRLDRFLDDMRSACNGDVEADVEHQAENVE